MLSLYGNLLILTIDFSFTAYQILTYIGSTNFQTSQFLLPPHFPGSTHRRILCKQWPQITIILN